MARVTIVHPKSILLFRTLSKVFSCFALICVSACAQSYVRPLARTAETHLPLPSRIVVHNFAIDASDVNEYQGILRQQPSIRNPIERQRLLADKAANVLAGQLVHGLRQFGFTVEWLNRSTSPSDGDLTIDGRFLSVDEGSPLRRFIIGFGSGASKMASQVQVFHGSRRQRILEFVTQIDSGKMPGTVATAPVGAAAPVAVSVGMAAGSAVSAGLQADMSTVALMAAASADQAMRYLSEFFARQGWIDAAKIKKARIGQ